MKFSILSATAFAACASVQAFSFDQAVLSLANGASDLLQSTFSGLYHKNPMPLAEELAATAHVDLESLSADLQAQWREFEQQSQKLQAGKRVLKEPIRHKKRPDSEWMHILKSEDFPNHTLRIKSPESLGIDTVKQYSGYLDIEDETKHLFFWFFESRNDPANDPVVLWLNGGPGCSSMTGLFFELGPASINKKIKPVTNDYAWNSNASIIFLDEPVNVGFSYSEKRVGTTRAAGEDVYAMLNLFFEKFPQYNGNGFHIAGESYAGHYIPAIATAIQSHPLPERVFNLTSLLIGNGITDSLHQAPAYKMMACGEGGHPAILDQETCDNYNNDLPTIQRLMSACYEHQDRLRCIPASFAENRLLEPFEKSGLNIYDIRTKCDDSAGGLCYKQLDYIDQYLNDADVQDALGVEAMQFAGCADSVGVDFTFTGDGSKPFHYDVAALLEAEIPILIYAGDKDFICNWVGQTLWLDALVWSGQQEYLNKETKQWTVGGKPAGEGKSAQGLTFLRVYEAGHMVPYNQPEAALAMLNTWLEKAVI